MYFINISESRPKQDKTLPLNNKSKYNAKFERPRSKLVCFSGSVLDSYLACKTNIQKSNNPASFMANKLDQI